EYIKTIQKIKEYISYGDTYQVNYTIKTKFNFSGSILGFYSFLKQNQKVSYSSFIKTKDFSILSFSPELFFKKNDNFVIVKPMKGTISRGKNIIEDKIQIKKLKNSIKNRAENVMIVDLLRNDLGKISEYGKVQTKKLFEIEKYETLFQMTSTI
ncbi:MAG: chorismate-binding protein, partial [Endomicrobia bacterium]|nr:chorismate-binding protein [Endomicrobiia bacterium]